MKGNMLIAVFAVMSIVSGIGAAYADENFTAGAMGSLRNVSFDTASGDHAGVECQVVPEPGKLVPAADDSIGMENNLNRVIKVAIVYSETTGPVSIKPDLIKLLQKGTLEEKYAFVYNKGGSYEFPARFVTRNYVPQVCVSSHKEQECHNQLVCNIVCDAAAGAAAAGSGPAAGAVIGGGAAVCHKVCESVPNCSDITVCDQWVDSPQNHGTDSHGNWE